MRFESRFGRQGIQAHIPGIGEYDVGLLTIESEARPSVVPANARGGGRQRSVVEPAAHP
jgi:hypothetical protein